MDATVTMRERTRALAQALIQARRSGALLDAGDWHDAVEDLDEVYALQSLVAAELGWAGASASLPQYWKSGGASRQGPFTHAALAPDGIGRVLKTWPLLGFEAEIALRLGQDISPAEAQALQPGEAGRCLDAMCVAVELVSSRWSQGLAAPELLRMADQQSNAGLLLGPWQPYQARDWAQQSFTTQLNDEPAMPRTGGHALKDPAWLLPAWLQHLTRTGQHVPAGTVVTTGAWSGCLPLTAKARRLRIEFEGLGVVEQVL